VHCTREGASEQHKRSQTTELFENNIWKSSRTRKSCVNKQNQKKNFVMCIEYAKGKRFCFWENRTPDLRVTRRWGV